MKFKRKSGFGSVSGAVIKKVREPRPPEIVELERYFDHVTNELIPMIQKCGISIILLSPGTPDAKQCLEVGASIMLDKPIIIVAINGAKIPPMLRKLNPFIIETDDYRSEATRFMLEDAIQALTS